MTEGSVFLVWLMILGLGFIFFYACCKAAVRRRRNNSENTSAQLPEFRQTMSERRRQQPQQLQQGEVAPVTTIPQAPPPTSSTAPTERTEEQIKKQLFFRSLEDGESVRSLEILLAAANDRYEANTDGSFLARSYRAATSSVRTFTGKPECCICLDGYETTDVVCWAKTDQCDHLFHDRCIIEWLKDHDDCPLCRTKLMIVED